MKKALKEIATLLSPNLRRRLSRLGYQKSLPKEFRDHVKGLTKTSLAIDLGANVGHVSDFIARTGARVLAFEPNCEALTSLRTVAKNRSNIEIFPVAAGVQERKTALYLHKEAELSSRDFTQASSLMREKPNVSVDNVRMVDEIDFAEFLTGLGHHVDLIKIDIEGYELDLLDHVLDKVDLSIVDRIYVETHERKWPALSDRTSELKNRIAELGLREKFFFDWV